MACYAHSVVLFPRKCGMYGEIVSRKFITFFRRTFTMKSSKSKKMLLILVLTFLLSTAQFALGADIPPNDDCSNAQAIGNVTDLVFDTSLATDDGPGHLTVSQNIWYTYTATCTGCVTISLCGSSFDTVMVVYNKYVCYPTPSNIVATSDDFCRRQSEVTFPVITGNQYLIEIGGYNETHFGEGVINIVCNGELSRPANDNCSKAISIVGSVMNLPFDTRCATFDGPNHGCIRNNNIWYHYTATQTGKVTVSLCGSHFDTMLAIYDGYTCYPDESDLIDCNDDDPNCGWQSAITFNAIDGNDYLIEIGGYDTPDVGAGVISIFYGGPVPGPLTNDDCVNATSVGNVTHLEFDTTEATFDGPGHFMTSRNIWYCYTATCTGEVTVDLCGSEFDTKLAIYKGCDCYPSLSDLKISNDDACGQQSRATLTEVTAGEHYLIEVGGYGSNYGKGLMSISCEGEPGPGPCEPSNDNCSDAKPVGNVTNLAFDTTCATFDGPGHYLSSPNIWYLYTAVCTCNVTVSLCGSGYDTKLAVYNGADCYPTAGNLLKYNDDSSCGWQSELIFAATAGNKYLIEVGGFGVKTGQGVLTITSEGAPVPMEFDLGDAPDSTNNAGMKMTAYPLGIQANFPTVFNDGSGTGPYGPIHSKPLAVAHLGKDVTFENEADIGPDQDGGNNIKPQANSADHDKADDGVVFPLNLPNCRWTTLDYNVNVINPGTDLWVNIWFDWNRDGDWDDDSSTNKAMSCSRGLVSEWAVQNQFLYNLSAGLHKITSPAFIPWHPAQEQKEIWMRITLSEQPWKVGSGIIAAGNSGSGPQAGYEIGETEDYYFIPDTVSIECEDINGDGEVNLQDLSAFVANWLANCPQ